MSLVPDDKRGKIQFFQTKLPRWAENAEQIGLSSEQVAEMNALTADALEAWRAQRLAQNAARVATSRLHLALDKMMNTGAAMIGLVRAKAKTSGEQVYVLSAIPAPSRPSPIGEPGQPEGFAAKLLQVGWIELRWKCKHPKGAVGTMYKVERAVQLAGETTWGEFVYLGDSGKKKFLDTTVPAGTQSIIYRVRARRSTKTEPEATHFMRLGGSEKQWAAFGKKAA